MQGAPQEAPQEAPEEWFTAQVPAEWQPEVTIAGSAATVVAHIPEPAGMEGSPSAAAGRIARFREDTRPRRVEIAQEAEARLNVTVTWGASCGAERQLFTPGASRGWEGSLVRV
jgi:hypothetical protein